MMLHRTEQWQTLRQATFPWHPLVESHADWPGCTSSGPDAERCGSVGVRAHYPSDGFPGRSRTPPPLARVVAEAIADTAHTANIDINRNMIGAVVGVTASRRGRPLRHRREVGVTSYLPRPCAESSASVITAAADRDVALGTDAGRAGTGITWAHR